MTQALSKDINYRLTGDTSGLDRAFKSAEKSASVFERELAKLEARQRRVDEAAGEIGRGLLVAGAAIGAGLAIATRAAVEWESAWAGVAKVVEGTPEQLAALEGQLRDLGNVLPATQVEIAGVAAEAGALGVAREDIADFTKTMIDLGESTNLSANEAADGIARMMNIMRTAPADVRRLGSTLVDLGNHAAATESEIVEMALRIAGAGKTVGLTEAEVLSFATALSSVGIEAEAGGSSISRAFITIDAAVREGGDALDTFARLAGLTADEFRTRFQVDAAGAITLFIQGLGRMQAAGGNVFKTLENLGLSEIRVRDALLKLSNAGDLVTRTLDVGNQAWADNNALTEEAERRYQTTEARMAIARNQLNDFAIDIGQALLPALGAAADTLGNVAGLLGDLPGPVKTALGVIGALAAALLLTGGIALSAVPKIAAYRAAVDTLATSQGRLAAATVAASGAMGRVGSFLGGPWGVAIGLAVAAVTAFGLAQAKTRQRIAEMADTLDEQTGAVTDNTRVWVVNQLEQQGVLAAADRLGVRLDLVTDAALGNKDALAQLNGELERASDLNLKDAIARAEAGKSIDQQDKDIGQLGGAVRGLGSDLEKATESQRRQAAATDDASGKTRELDPLAQNLAETFGLTADEASDAADEISDLDRNLKALLDTLFGTEEAEDATAEAATRLIEQVKEAAKAGDKNARSLEGQSKSARDNRAAVRDLVGSYVDQIQKYAETGASSEQLKTKTEELRQKFIEQMRQAGFSEESIRDYARAFDEIPALVATTLRANNKPALAAIAKVKADVIALGKLHPKIHATVFWTSKGLHVPGGTILEGGGVGSQRWGGIIEHAQAGVLRDAAVFGPGATLYAFREPGTGGEAFVPRFGPVQRALDVLNRAAAWYDAMVLPRTAMAAAATASGLAGGNIYNINLSAYSDRFSLRQVMNDLAYSGVS